MGETQAAAWVRPIPNLLTMLRIVAACALPFVPVAWRLPVVVFGGLSDWADGVIARRFHAQSPFGTFMDGVADKLLVLSCVVTFVTSGDVSLWQGLLVMARDIVVTLLVAIIALGGTWRAFEHVRVRRAGKLTTALVFPWFASLLIPAIAPLRPWLFWPAAVVSVVAAIDYTLQFATKGSGPTPTP